MSRTGVSSSRRSEPVSKRATRTQTPKTLERLRKVGPRPNVLQIVPPRHVYRPAVLRAEDRENHELVTNPLATPTGPHGAAGFKNRAGSQIATPHVTNVYMGPYWGDRAVLEGFSKAIVENGYLDPLHELGCGTGSGAYIGTVDGEDLAAGTTLDDSEARVKIQAMLDSGVLHADANTLFMLLLPDGVTSLLGSDASCSFFCGYHEAFNYHGTDVAYAILPSPTGCSGCGNGELGDFTAVYAHELAEAATDKVPGKGWTADDGQENGDLE